LNDLLLWLDLECTGSDAEHDSIIEIGCILTTPGLDPLGEFTAVVEPQPEGYGRMMLNDVVRTMHRDNGLLLDLFAGLGRKQHEVTRDLLEWLEGLGAQQGKTVLAGSGVGHYDRKFIDRYMPQLSRFLRYWCIDIGVIRRAHDMWVGTTVSTANESKTHRALDDIRCHLKEAEAFRDLWELLP
jgi:oligoribonuclease